MSIKNVRTSQILSPFGVGQIVNFPGEESLMICGLNLWDKVVQNAKEINSPGSIDESILRINDKRLEKLLNVKYFVKPFAYKVSGSKNNRLTIPAVRFPQWHYCTVCGKMKFLELQRHGNIDDDFNVRCSCGGKIIPVRFIAACADGHIQDVPFLEWVHDGSIIRKDEKHTLFYYSLPGAGDLSSILIKCSCGKKRTLAGIMNVKWENGTIVSSALSKIGNKSNNRSDNDKEVKTGEYCKGLRPWLGEKNKFSDKECNKHLQVLVRGGSNVHYSNIVSALYLPQSSTSANEYVTRVVDRITLEKIIEYYNQDHGDYLLKAIIDTQPEVVKKMISSDELLLEIKKLIETAFDNSKDNEISETDLRYQEYLEILNGREVENSDFKACVKTFDGYTYSDFLKKYFKKVVLVEKLKETRVFKGFSRIKPNYQIDTSDLSAESIEWLPAYEVYGEGIFIQFDDSKIDSWEIKHGKEFQKLIDRYNIANSRRYPDRPIRKINAIFVMMHTFTHLLIKRLCYDCGYGSSSLRERIYFNHNKSERMNGVLIYTSSGDTDGSLGGLVRQGREKYLGKLIKEAIEDARWCSADPVCSEIGQSSGQGPDNVNGSACHNCCIVPETSCEEFNMLLDRATIIGTLDKRIGYFE